MLFIVVAMPVSICPFLRSELELTVSIPFRIGKKRLANHTLLVCTGSEISVEKDSNFKVGDVIWAKAAMLPAWPGKIISYKDKDLKKPPNDKVSRL